MDDFIQPKFHKRYVPAPLKPFGFDQSVLLMAGMIEGQPRLKVGWSHDLRTFRNDDHNALKYPGHECWIIEGFMPPSLFGTSREWSRCRYNYGADGKKIDAIGPYPGNGMYGFRTAIMTPVGEYIALDSDVLLWMQMNVESLINVVPDAYKSATAFKELQEKSAADEEKMWATMDEETSDLDDYVAKNQDRINRNPEFSLPSIVKPTLWTPEGEVSL